VSKLYGKYRRGTKFTLSFPTLPSITAQPIEVELIQEQKSHDVLVLKYHSVTKAIVKQLKTGVPVKFVWSQGKRKREWLGYVSSTVQKNGVQRLRPLKVYCSGSSYKLKQRITKTYKNKTIPEVAALIAKRNKLKFVGDRHSRRYDQLVISGQSQWEWLHQHANKIGFAMYVKGTNLVFRSIDKLINEGSADAPLFQMWDNSIPRSSKIIDRTLDTIEVLVGANNEDGSPSRSKKQVGGVNPVTGKPFTAKKSPKKSGKQVRKTVNEALFDEFKNDEVAHSKGAAKDAAEGAAQLARFNIPAKANGIGDPRLMPYTVISVEGSGEETDGFWLVKKITHTFKFSGSYHVEMLVAIDGTENNQKAGTVQASTNGVRQTEIDSLGRVNLNQLLSEYSAFSVGGGEVSINLAEVFSTNVGIGSQVAPLRMSSSADRSGTSRLAIRRPMLSSDGTLVSGDGGIGGLLDPQAFWETTVPSSSSVTRHRKCR
jgi:phage protein D